MGFQTIRVFRLLRDYPRIWDICQNCFFRTLCTERCIAKPTILRNGLIVFFSGCDTFFKNEAFRALCSHLLFQLWTFSFFIHFKTKANKFVDFIRQISWILKILWKSNFVGGYFFNFDNLLTFPGVMWGPKKIFGRISSTDLKFIGYKQTDTQTNKLLGF